MVGPSSNYMDKSDSKLFANWIQTDSWASEKEDAENLKVIAKRYSADFLVLDDYRIKLTYQLFLHQAGIRWLQFEQCPLNARYADWVVYANPNAIAYYENHEPLNKNQVLFLGPSYAVLRKEFWGSVYSQSPATNDDFLKIVCILGGGSDRGVVRYVVEEFKNLDISKKSLTIVAGFHNPLNVENKILCSQFPEIQYIVDPEQVAGFIRGSDIAVSSGGTLTYEFASLGIPMIIIALAQNQISAQSWEDAGCAIYAGEYKNLEYGYLKRILMRIAENKNIKNKMILSQQKYDCGQGALKIAQQVLSDLGVP